MKTEVNGLSVYYEEYGPSDGPHVLVLPGWMAKASLYRVISDAVSEKYHVILLDMPGFTGGTPEPPVPWDLDAFTDFVTGFIEALSIDALTLIGHSFGGRVIIKMANRPDLPFEISRIVLIDSAGIKHAQPGSVKFKQSLFRAAKNFVPDKIVERYKETHGSADYRAASPLMRECMVLAINEDLRPILSGVTPEVLLIWGTNDTDTPIEDALIMESEMPNAYLAKIEGVGHFSFMEAPAVFTNILRSYLK